MNIHWHEGLFLQPHHLQRFQRSIVATIQSDRCIAQPFAYGVIEGQVSADELANYRVRFTRLRAIMPSGLEVDFPKNADLPSLDIKPLFAGTGSVFTIYLGVPLWQDGRANSGGEAPADQPDTNAKIIFRVHEQNLTDENTGDNSQPLLTRHVNARFVLDDGDKSDLELVPVLRLTRSAGEQLGQPKIDAEFVPPCLFLTGSGALHNLVADIVNQIEASRQELLVQVNRGGFNMETVRGVQIEQILRLRTLGHFSARLAALLEAPNITPFEWYLELCSLHGELSALHPEKDGGAPPSYSHEGLYNVFSQLDGKIRALLRGVVAASFMRLDFARTETGLAATLSEDHITRAAEYFLAVRSEGDTRTVAALVEDGNRFKLMPKSLASRAIRGVELKEERFPPMQLPASAGLSFFRLNSTDSSRIWQQIKQERELSLHWPETDVKIKEVAIYMTTNA
ncbi:MAG: type VI secretion system baseplate subunit TssK [Puniceicoccales bacterium]|jgi:type VI secretion system ImpJ/VasE family protein|nr:type VI secretion system baseplate subunit TssK [Puniceicoccales bacterium]